VKRFGRVWTLFERFWTRKDAPALVIRPNYGEAWSNLGIVLQSQDKLHEAIECYEMALALKPHEARAYQKLDCALYSSGRLDEALRQHRRAKERQPDYAEACFSESLVQLAQGDFDNGWENYEARWRTKEQTPMREYEQPLWTGETLKAGWLLLWGKQGLGDEVMFAGLLPEVMQRGNRCVLDCDRRLRPLLARSFAGLEVLAGELPLEGIAAHLPIGSLPRLLRRSHGSFAATGDIPREIQRWAAAGGAGPAHKKQEDGSRAIDRLVLVCAALGAGR
jgi:tetratricopeptide (TPR) repeat protein